MTGKPENSNNISKIEQQLRSQLESMYQLAVSVDCVIFGYDDEDLKVLVIESDMPKYKGMLSLPGYLVDPDTDLEEAAQIVLKDRTGLSDLYMEQVMAFGERDRHPLGRVITIAYYSLVEINKFQPPSDQKNKPQWLSLNQVNELAFDHKKILETCLQRLRLRLQEQPLGFNLLPDKFSLKQLQRLYESVLGIELDKRNFRRKLKSLDVLIDLGEFQKAVSNRPAKLYKFDLEKYNAKKKKGMFMNF